MANTDLIQVENEILDIIEAELKSGGMDADKCSSLARLVLTSLTEHMTHLQILEHVKTMSKSFPELIPIVLEMQNEEHSKIQETIGNHVQNLLKEGRIDEANILLTDTLSNNG